MALPLLQESLTRLAKLLLPSKQEKQEEDKALKLATILTLLALLLGEEQGSRRGRSELYAFTAYKQEALDLQQEVDSLLLVTKTFLSCFSFNDWISCLELPSSLALQHSPLLAYWPSGPPPSNMQLLIGHRAALASEGLQARGLSKEVQEMLAPLARRYDRSLELGLEERDIEELVSGLQEGEEWQQEAVVEHLATTRLGEVLARPDLLASLPSRLLAPHVRKVRTSSTQ